MINAVDRFKKDSIGKSNFRDPESTNYVRPSTIVSLNEKGKDIVV